jgi:hypothetical protein
LAEGREKVTTAAQLFAIFAFGLVMTGVVFLGVLRAREAAEKSARSEAATTHRQRESD